MTDATRAPNEDPELKAMLALIRYLDPLGQAACARVIKWAEDRYICEALPEFPPDSVSNFMRALGDAAQQMDGMSGHDILLAAAQLAELRNGEARDPSKPEKRG